MTKRLAIVTTHPIQYNAPVFRMLTERGNISIKVFYTWGESVLKNKYDPGFGKIIEWDIPLLQGYDFVMVDNISKEPGSHHYKGIDNPSLNHQIENWKADAVMIFGWNFKSHLSCMKFFHNRVPVIFRGDSTLLDQGGNVVMKMVRKLVLHYVYRHSDYFLYTGKANKEYYHYAGVNEKRLVFAPHAIDNDRFSPAVMTIDFRKENDIPEDAVLFLYAGKFEEKKNVGMLIEAFAMSDHPESFLLLVGNGPKEADLKSQAASLPESTKNRIRFADFQNQLAMPDVYGCCDVFVLPSKGPGETWGLAVNEAMASGKAVLVSDKCGAAYDLVDDAANGYVFQAKNINSLAEKFILLMRDRLKLKSYGAVSSALIKKWSFENICISIENVTNDN